MSLLLALTGSTGGNSQSLAITLDGVTVNATQELQHSQSMAITLDSVAVSVSQSKAGGISQALAITLDGVTSATNQVANHPQSLSITLDSISATVNQSVGSASKSQSLDITLDDVTASITQQNSHVSNDLTPIRGWIRNTPTKEEEDAERIKLGIIEAKKEIKRVVRLIKQVEVQQERTESITEASKLAIHKKLLDEQIKRANDEYEALLRRINTNYLRARLEAHKAIKRQQTEENDIVYLMSMLASM